MNCITRHFTAWLTTDPSALTGGTVDVSILEDTLTGEDPADDTSWSCDGSKEPVFFSLTGTDTLAGNHQTAQDQADQLMRESGWTRMSDWIAVDCGYLATVEQD